MSSSWPKWAKYKEHWTWWIEKLAYMKTLF